MSLPLQSGLGRGTSTPARAASLFPRRPGHTIGVDLTLSPGQEDPSWPSGSGGSGGAPVPLCSSASMALRRESPAMWRLQRIVVARALWPASRAMTWMADSRAGDDSRCLPGRVLGGSALGGPADRIWGPRARQMRFGVGVATPPSRPHGGEIPGRGPRGGVQRAPTDASNVDPCAGVKPSPCSIAPTS